MFPPRATDFLSSLLMPALALSAPTTPARRTQSNAKERRSKGKSLLRADRPQVGEKAGGPIGAGNRYVLKRWRHA